MNNKRLGNNFEQEYAEKLEKLGFWVTFLTPKSHIGSQPADLIAIKNDEVMLVDCKTCSTDIFPLSRIEENQRQAYKKYKACGNTQYIIAIKYDDDIFLVNMKDIDFTQKSIKLERRTNEDNSFKQHKSNRSR